MASKTAKIISLAIPVLLLVSLSFALYFLSPEDIVELIGVENAYLFIFILAFAGGFAIFGTIPYHVVLVTLAAGGLSAPLLGLAAALGVMIGDSISYFIGWQGSAVVPERMHKFFHRWYALIERHPNMLPLFCFLYGSLIPFSNDFITLSAGLARYPYRRVMIPLGLGNLVFNMSLAFFALFLYEFFTGTVAA